MKRLILISFIITVFLIGGCSSNDVDSYESASITPSTSSDGNSVSEIQSKPQNSNEPTTSKDDKSVSDSIFYQEYELTITPDLLPKTEHEKQLLRRLGAEIAKQVEDVPPEFEDRKKYSGDLYSYIYEDFDNDGTFEMFAETSLVASCVMWFIDDEDVVMMGASPSFSVKEPLVLDMQKQKFVVFKLYGDEARTTDYIYGVRDGIPYETNISKYMIDGTNQYGEVLVVETTYDAFIDGAGDVLGRTWKPYYFYIDETGNFKEYGGIEASLDFVRSMNGAETILQGHFPEDAKIESIYYRDNGVININYFLEERGGKAMSYITLRYDGSQARLETAERGIYLTAYLSEMAEFPTSLPDNT